MFFGRALAFQVSYFEVDFADCPPMNLGICSRKGEIRGVMRTASFCFSYRYSSGSFFIGMYLPSLWKDVSSPYPPPQRRDGNCEHSSYRSGGSLVKPLPPQSTGFRPPSIFSPPLARGSGARALGVAGAFTAVADDATAASWNPAGLIELERPEASFMLRETRVVQEHHIDSESFSVGEDKFDDRNLNYLSAVYPLRLADRNFVFSLNYQEAYDFNQTFTADQRATSSQSRPDTSTTVFTETVQQHVDDGHRDDRHGQPLYHISKEFFESSSLPGYTFLPWIFSRKASSMP